MTNDRLHADNLDDVWRLVSRDAIADLGFEDCVIYEIDKQNHTLVQRAVLWPENVDNRHMADPISIPIGKRVAGSVAVSGKPDIVSDTRVDPRYAVDDSSHLSEIAVPIFHNGRIIGVVASANKQSDFFSNVHREALSIVASFTSARLAYREGETHDRTDESIQELKPSEAGQPYNENPISATISAGIEDMNRKYNSLNDALEAADRANFIAKRMGRNQDHIARADDTACRSHSNREAWAVEVGEALESGRLCIFTQPVFNLLQPRQILMWESLLRMRRDNGELVTAAEFLASCEQFDQMHRVDRWVVHSILDWISHNAKTHSLPTISINISSASVGDPDFPACLIDGIRQRGIDTRKVDLCVEIAETAAISNIDQVQALARSLNENHIKIAIDDFGSEYASFALLKHLNADVVKIDRFFTNSISSTLDRRIVNSINNVAHEIGATTVVGGVEDLNTLLLLRQLGIDYVQGYLLARPAPIDSLLNQKAKAATVHQFDDICRATNLMVSGI